MPHTQGGRHAATTLAAALLSGLALSAPALAQQDEAPAPGCPTGGNQVTGTAGLDTLTGTRGADNVNALDGDDTVSTLLGDDCVVGAGGFDVISGG